MSILPHEGTKRLKLKQLRNFAAVAERGGLRRAARHLGVPQPAISRSIRDLEKELGATLFERSAMGMELTPIGQAFLRRIAAVQLELERSFDEVQQLKGRNKGTVSIGLSTAPHVGLLPQIIVPFKRRFPEVMLDIREGFFPSMEGQIREGSIDFYVGPLSEHNPGGDLIVEKLFDNRRAILARPGHPLGRARSLRELVDAQWVATSVMTSGEAELSPVFERHGLPRPTISVQAHSALTMLTVATSSDLLAMLPQQWLPFVRSTGLLTLIEIQEELAAPAICIVRRARLPLAPVAEHLSDLFRRVSSQRSTAINSTSILSATTLPERPRAAQVRV